MPLCDGGRCQRADARAGGARHRELDRATGRGIFAPGCGIGSRCRAPRVGGRCAGGSEAGSRSGSAGAARSVGSVLDGRGRARARRLSSARFRQSGALARIGNLRCAACDGFRGMVPGGHRAHAPRRLRPSRGESVVRRSVPVVSLPTTRAGGGVVSRLRRGMARQPVQRIHVCAATAPLARGVHRRVRRARHLGRTRGDRCVPGRRLAAGPARAGPGRSGSRASGLAGHRRRAHRCARARVGISRRQPPRPCGRRGVARTSAAAHGDPRGTLRLDCAGALLDARVARAGRL